MADRSLWPDGVEVHSRHLTNETDNRVASDRQFINNVTSGGVLSGLEVTINSGDDTKVDVAAGGAFAPNGDYMLHSIGQQAMALEDNTLGVENYVLLVYDEEQSLPEAHEADGVARNTKAVNSPRLVILTAANYGSLPPQDTVLSNNDLDRATLVAIVTGNGGSPLTTGLIESPTTFNATLQATKTSNITGLTILQVSPNTPVGSGIVYWNITAGDLTWEAPSDTAGSGVIVAVSGVYVLTSAGGYTMTVDVAFSQLPSVNKQDAVTVVNLYGQTVTRFTGIDAHHRSKLGSGISTVANPHGMTLDDLSPGAGGSLEEHQDVMHANGIVKSSSTSLLSASVNTGTAPDSLDVTGFTTGDLAYINGKKISDITGSTTFPFTSGVTSYPSLYGIYLTEDGTLIKSAVAEWAGTVDLLGLMLIIDVVNMPAGSYPLTLNLNGTMQWDSGPLQDDAASNRIIRLYSQTRTGYIDVFFAGPGGVGSNTTDTITINALPSLATNTPVAMVPWSGTATGYLGYGFGAANSPNYVYDKRLYGTLSEAKVRTDSGIANTTGAVHDILGDGIVLRTRGVPGANGDIVTDAQALADQFVLGAYATPNVVLNGGLLYLDGRRIEIATTTLALTNSAINTIYVNSAGQVLVSTSSWADIISAVSQAPLMRLYDVTINGVPAETARTDWRVYAGHKKNQRHGVVGLDVYGRASITSTTDADAGALQPPALTITATHTNGTALSTTGNGSGHGAILTADTGYGAWVATTGAGTSAFLATAAGSGTKGAAITATDGIGATIAGGGANQGATITGGGTSTHSLQLAGPAQELRYATAQTRYKFISPVDSVDFTTGNFMSRNDGGVTHDGKLYWTATGAGPWLVKSVVHVPAYSTITALDVYTYNTHGSLDRGLKISMQKVAYDAATYGVTHTQIANLSPTYLQVNVTATVDAWTNVPIYTTGVITDNTSVLQITVQWDEVTDLQVGMMRVTYTQTRDWPQV